MLWLMNMGFAAGGAAAPQPDPEPTVTPAGKGHRRYFVEIDGQQFLVNDVEQARQLLQRARAIAEHESEKKAVRAEKKLKRRVKVSSVPVVRVPQPVIRLAPELRAELMPIVDDIKRLYSRAAELAELRLLMLKAEIAQRDDDEEDDLLLLL
jgi:hypothetical protein